MEQIRSSQTYPTKGATLSDPTPRKAPWIIFSPILLIPIVSGLTFVLCLAWEGFAPTNLKPSYFVGSFENAVIEAQELGRLQAETKYKSYIESQELAKLQLQEQYRVLLQAASDYYKATFVQVDTLQKAGAEIQKQYVSQRMQQMNRMNGMEIAIANLASMARLAGVLSGNSQLADAATQVIAAIKGSVMSDLQMSAETEVVRQRGWDLQLMTPDKFSALMQPIPSPAFQTYEEFVSQVGKKREVHP